MPRADELDWCVVSNSLMSKGERERDSRPHADMHACVYMHRHPAATLHYRGALDRGAGKHTSQADSMSCYTSSSSVMPVH